MKSEYLVDIPKELFSIFSKKYGAGESKEKVIDCTKYLIQPLTLQTNAWHAYKPWRDEGKSVVTIGLFQDGTPERMTEVTRFVVWNHIPEVSGAEAFHVWGGIYGTGSMRTERLIPHFGNGLNPVDLVVPETKFIIEVMQVACELGENIKPRRYAYQENTGFVPEKEYRYV